LIHPSAKRDQEKPERIEGRHVVVLLSTGATAPPAT
jgi:hypothetical protein